MNFGLNKYNDTISLNYINDIFLAVNKAVINSSKKNNIESFNELLDFIQYTLLTGSFKRSLNCYSKACTNLIYLYPNLNSNFKKIYIERIFDSLSMKISLSEKYDKEEFDYIELSYLPLINLLKLILEEDDFNLFNEGLQKIENSLFSIDYRKDNNGYSLKFLTIMLCWIYYLKFQTKISFDRYNFSYFEDNFDSVVGYDNNFLNDFFNLFDEIEKKNLWSVNNWETKKPPMNKAYFVLQPKTWLTFGLVIILLKYSYLIRATDDLKKIELKDRFRYIFDDIEKILKEITIENKEYMNFIFNEIEQTNDVELNYRKEKIISLFSYLKKEIEIENYKQIMQVPLSINKIEEFRNNVGELWERNTVIFNVLQKLEKVIYLANNKSINGFGFFRTFLKMRFAFIEGKHHQNIIGLADFGASLAKNMDDLFFKKLIDFKTKIINKDIIGEIDLFIEKSKNKNNLIIFANWRNEKKLINIEESVENNFPFSNKTYNNIPIINVFNSYKDYIFIVDFSNIEIKVYTNDEENWYKNMLIVDVTEYQKDIVTDETIREWKEKDNITYNYDEVDVLEKNNVNVKIIFKFEYIIPDSVDFLILE